MTVDVVHDHTRDGGERRKATLKLGPSQKERHEHIERCPCAPANRNLFRKLPEGLIKTGRSTHQPQPCPQTPYESTAAHQCQPHDHPGRERQGEGAPTEPQQEERQ